MRFEDFARAHGLIIQSLVIDKWTATPTEDHPRKTNGRYKFMGDHGWVQNWATMTKPVLWKSENPMRPSPSMLRARKEAEEQRIYDAQRAAKRAGWMLKNSKLEPHPYLASKGFPDQRGAVWNEDGKKLLVIPMRVDGRLVGAQLIDDEGNKKFLKGQVTKGASFIVDAKGVPIFCEGFATALSVRAAMQAIKIRYKIYVCFSAGNMETVARGVPGGFVVADHDASGVGERAASAAKKPYWLSPALGEDFNDYEQRVGLFQASSSLKQFVIANKVFSSPEEI